MSDYTKIKRLEKSGGDGVKEGLNNALLQDSVVGGNLHSGNVTNHYYHVNEVKAVPILKTKRKQPKRKQTLPTKVKRQQTLPTKVKRQQHKRKGTWVRLYALGLRDFISVLFLMTISLVGIFFILVMGGW